MISEERLWQLWDTTYDDQTNEWHTIKFARAVELEARREALDEAALICDLCGTSAIPANASADNCAAAIRALVDRIDAALGETHER